MSGYPTGSGGNDGRGLDSLFAQLRQQQNQSAAPVHLEPSYNYYNNNNNNNGFFGQNQQLPSHYQQPSVSSPLPTPPMHAQQHHHNSAIMSPVDTPHAEPPRLANPVGTASGDNRTSSLLNLLKFSQPSASKSTSQAAPIGTPLPPSRDSSMNFGGNSDVLGQVSAGNRGGQDLLAALMGGAQQKPVSTPQMTQASPQFANASQPQSSSSFAAATSPPADTQAYLLRLLNQPKPPQTGDESPHLNTEKVLTPPSKASSLDEVGDLAQTLEDTKIDMDMSMMGSAAFEGKIERSLGKENTRDVTPQPRNNQGLFTYVNPFEELAASSPRNRTPKAATAGPSNPSASAPAPAFQILKRQDSTDNKRKMDERSNVDSPGQAFSKRKLGSPAVSSGPPTPLPDGRTQLEALIGIGAPSPAANGKGKETVSHALEEVGDTVDQEVQEALARAEQDASNAEIEKDLRNMLAAKTESQFEDRAQVAATAIKKVLDKDETVLDDLPTPVADEVKEIIDDAAQGHIADSWESADAEDAPPTTDETVIKVFNFPMKPWTSITIKNSEEGRPIFRDEVIVDIARLKKEFDQIDRTLVTASSNFIVYGMSKNGGIRIIRQTDGKDSRLFTETHDRIFNVSTSSAPADLKDTIIGTGISGTVYWAVVKDGEGDFIEENHPETHGFALPPIQTPDNESAGGVLKTRARKSSNHPEFFAVGRGKSIQIIYPSVIMKNSFLKNGKERIVDTDRYLAHRSLKVNTGKAGKDFTFSEDDTTIVSLDKAGRVKFWDVRPLTQIPEDELHQKAPPVEIKEPLTTLITTPATEKSWPTSVLFVDKLRPYQKGGPLRYMIVGMKQNHTLQLWDLALGKPVQEIHLPHSKESDAVCSVLYHPATGVIVVGHPTRNSIYFLHLSAPKYNLPRTVTQAEYVERLANNDSSVSKPESTAVVSGMREYSFASKGNLRSLDILQNPAAPSNRGEPITLFELYAMHSKGVTCLNIKQADLGWDANNKCISAVVADRVGAVTIDTLKEINTAPPATPSESSEPAPESSLAPAPTPTRIIQRPAAKENTPKETKKTAQPETFSVPKAEEKVEKKEVPAALSSGGLAGASGTENKAEKKKRRKANSSSEFAVNSSQPKNVATENISAPRNGSASRANMNNIPDVGSSSSFSTTGLTEEVLKDIEGRVSGEVKKLLNDSFNSLDQRIKDDRRTQNAVNDAKQDAVLRLVSSTLTGNLEESLKRIVNGALENSIVPSIENITLKTIDQRVSPALANHLNQSLPRELEKILPDAVNKVMQQPQLLKLMSETLAKSVSFPFEEQFATLLNNSITPAFTQLAVNASQRVAADVHRQAQEQIGNIERQRHADSLKIEQLTQLVTGLTETISSMAAAQSEFQAQFLRVQQRDRQASSSHRASPGLGHNSSRPSVSSGLAAPVVEEKSPQELEYEEMFKHIQGPMQEGRYEDAVVRWLQTGREQEFFARYFCRFSPKFITELSPLLLLSLGAIITIELTDDLMNQRLAWTETILNSFQIKMVSGYLEDQVADLVPKIMNIYIQRLEHLFMRITNVAPSDPLLKQLSNMVATANRILELYRERPTPRHMAGFSQ
ncbi:hypothetical protein sscle_11g083180 [Sclerotinia sclerotiorum 1980 UF-70]|uniref:EDC4-like protein pdc1 beta-propeller domain-containing protein n=1 Tax=Sclerotinia sclerotiorum (strain ATCC 18683 / 1980 / Ss-1) TaxID=665079 RepID=A0A1D9QF65_SCLS1|nr:hypothetical protein sscle_11g083180 [Sclerotinia sclerotiorum 1980 UF-70]